MYDTVAHSMLGTLASVFIGMCPRSPYCFPFCHQDAKISLSRETIILYWNAVATSFRLPAAACSDPMCERDDGPGLEDSSTDMMRVFCRVPRVLLRVFRRVPMLLLESSMS